MKHKATLEGLYLGMRECFPQIQSGEVIHYLQNLTGVKFRSFEFFKNLEENGGKSEKLVEEGK